MCRCEFPLAVRMRGDSLTAGNGGRKMKIAAAARDPVGSRLDCFADRP